MADVTELGDSGGVVLSCRGVSFAYLGRFPALDDVSFDVRRGETLGLLGANGSGKSTLLKILDGLLFADAGSYVALGEEITEDTLEDEQFSAAFRARVGFVFQNSEAQVFSPTVREEVAFGPLQLGLARDTVETRVQDALAMLGISELADRAPFQLSGGQQKKVAIASVLSMNPEILLFDEPTAALDPRTQRWFIDVLTELAVAGKTVVLATHDLGLAAELCGRCIVFGEDHRIAIDGRTDEVLAARTQLVNANLLDPAR